MKKPIKPITHPINIEITPRLLAAVEASAGRKVPPGARIMLMPPPPIMPPMVPTNPNTRVVTDPGPPPKRAFCGPIPKPTIMP